MLDMWNGSEFNVDGAQIGKEPLRALISGTIPTVLLRNLFSDQEIEDGRRCVTKARQESSVTQYSNGSLTLLGTFLVKNLLQLDKYFQEAATAEQRFLDWNLRIASTARARLRECLGLESFEVAADNGGRAYASSNVRICSNDVDTPLHNDFIMRDGVGYDVVLKSLTHQLSCVICLQGPGKGGELSIYKKRWNSEDEQYKIPGGLGYDIGVVSGAPVHRLRPNAGDVYLLNPTYYHAVERVTGRERITLGFFFGFFDDGLDQAVAWV